MIHPSVLAAFVHALGDIPVIRDPALVRQRSRDFFWYSPVLNRQLNEMTADIVVCARNSADVVRILAAACRYAVPITPRGGGTGTHGQAVPLAGGAVLDLTRLDRIVWTREGVLRVEAGARMIDIERVLRERGWELRMFPSTKRTATIGGFVCGGWAGIGSITWGGLRDAGNLIGVEVVTAEAVPRILQLRGHETDLVQHGYGTTGIVTEVELPLAPATAWIDVAVAFGNFMQGAGFCLALSNAPGIDRKLVSMIEETIVRSFRGLRERVSPGESLALLMVAKSSRIAVMELVAAHGGRIVIETGSYAAETGADVTPLYEYAWNHTTSHMLALDPSITYLQTVFPAADLLARVALIRERLGDELPMHLEFLRLGGAVTCVGLPIVRFAGEARLFEIIRIHEECGIGVANPHVFTLEERGHGRLPSSQSDFKREVDPFGLLNSGKMRDYIPVQRSEPVQRSGAAE